MSMEQSIEFFEKMLKKAQWNLKYAEDNLREPDATNIRKKVKHYENALDAIRRSVNESC